MEIDTSQFKAKNPLQDMMFWICAAVAAPMMISVLKTAWGADVVDVSEMLIAASPLLGYLARNGYVSGKGVQAFGTAAAAPVQNMNFPLAVPGSTGDEGMLDEAEEL